MENAKFVLFPMYILMENEGIAMSKTLAGQPLTIA